MSDEDIKLSLSDSLEIYKSALEGREKNIGQVHDHTQFKMDDYYKKIVNQAFENLTNPEFKDQKSTLSHGNMLVIKKTLTRDLTQEMRQSKNKLYSFYKKINYTMSGGDKIGAGTLKDKFENVQANANIPKIMEKIINYEEGIKKILTFTSWSAFYNTLKNDNTQDGLTRFAMDYCEKVGLGEAFFINDLVNGEKICEQGKYGILANHYEKILDSTNGLNLNKSSLKKLQQKLDDIIRECDEKTMTLEKLKEMNKDIMNSIMDEACDPTEVKKRTEKPEFDEFCTKLAYTRHTHLKKEQMKPRYLGDPP